MSAATSGTGIVIFLFTDIEGSALLWAQDPERMRVNNERTPVRLSDESGAITITFALLVPIFIAFMALALCCCE